MGLTIIALAVDDSTLLTVGQLVEVLLGDVFERPAQSWCGVTSRFAEVKSEE